MKNAVDAYSDATLIENDPPLQDETFTCVGIHEQLREGGNFQIRCDSGFPYLKFERRKSSLMSGHVVAVSEALVSQKIGTNLNYKVTESQRKCGDQVAHLNINDLKTIQISSLNYL